MCTHHSTKEYSCVFEINPRVKEPHKVSLTTRTPHWQVIGYEPRPSTGNSTIGTVDLRKHKFGDDAQHSKPIWVSPRALSIRIVLSGPPLGLFPGCYAGVPRLSRIEAATHPCLLTIGTSDRYLSLILRLFISVSHQYSNLHLHHDGECTCSVAPTHAGE